MAGQVAPQAPSAQRENDPAAVALFEQHRAGGVEGRGARGDEDPARRDADAGERSDPGGGEQRGSCGEQDECQEHPYVLAECRQCPEQGDHRESDPPEGGPLRWSERTRAACGPSGLFAEEYDVRQRQLRGNLPQAFVHALLLECAVRLNGASTLPP
ncbi:hypothetical protein C1I97_15335 [Streptomyces sp. NTH33]|nr:hypothetical protein C1I97_15335 [Streptomyces sp. NTH33]